MLFTLFLLGYSHANLQEGEELTIEELLNVLLIPSANDAAVVLAEHIAGSVEDFADLMNEKAKEIGCTNTNFVNPNGIHDSEHYSTAYDLALIGLYAMQFSDIMRIATVTQYTLPATNEYSETDRIFNATNGLIDSSSKYYYEYATGLKTGYTNKAGSCIVATAEKDGRELLAVILKSNSVAERYEDCETLFEYGFENYSYETICTAGSVVDTIEITNATDETKNLDVVIKDDISALVSSDTSLSTLTPTIEIETDLEAPIAENDVIGKISYTIDGEEYYSDLIAGSDVVYFGFEVFIFRGLLIFLILLIIYLLLSHYSKNKPSRRRKKYYSDDINTYKIKSKKKRRSKHSKFEKNDTDMHRIHNGKGEFKFTQIQDFL